MKLKDFPELRILAILGIITLGWHLLTIFGSFLGLFADIFILLILSWVLAFILEPLVTKISSKGVSRVLAAGIIYFLLAVAAIVIVWVVLPTTVIQISQFASLVPAYLPSNSVFAPQIESFFVSAANNSISMASGVASMASGTLLIMILSFYFLISKKEISQFIIDVIPDSYKEDYLFLEKTLNETFASFIQIQVFMGLILGLITLVVLLILGINFPLSTALFSSILAMIPVIGSMIFLVPVALAGITVSIQKAILAVTIIALASVLICNVLAPKLLGSVLKIHPIVILLTFIVGYRLGGLWGSIFAIPVTSVALVVIKDLIKYWKEEADK